MRDEPALPEPETEPAEPEGLIVAEQCDENHPGLAPARFLVERWRRAAASDPGRLPLRDLFAPETLGGLLGRISLLEPVDGGRDFRYRIHAGIAADVAGLDLSRKSVAELPYGDYRQAVLEHYRSTLRDERPRFDRIRLNWFGQVFDYVRAALPVADAASGTPLILSVMLHTDPGRPPYVSRFRSASVGTAAAPATAPCARNGDGGSAA